MKGIRRSRTKGKNTGGSCCWEGIGGEGGKAWKLERRKRKKLTKHFASFFLFLLSSLLVFPLSPPIPSPQQLPLVLLPLTLGLYSVAWYNETINGPMESTTNIGSRSKTKVTTAKSITIVINENGRVWLGYANFFRPQRPWKSSDRTKALIELKEIMYSKRKSKQAKWCYMTTFTPCHFKITSKVHSEPAGRPNWCYCVFSQLKFWPVETTNWFNSLLVTNDIRHTSLYSN